MKAFIITDLKTKKEYISYGTNLDNAIRALGFEFSGISGQRIPELDNLQVKRISKKNIRVIFNNKEHCLAKYKDSNNISSGRVTKLDNGKEWFSYASEIENVLDKFNYSRKQELINALFTGIKEINHIPSLA